MRIAGRVAVVTGASSGIGEAVALDLARRGATVVGMARRGQRLEGVIERCRRPSPESFAHVGDVSKRDDCEAAVKEAEARLGGVEILVNNAGITLSKPATETTVDDVERVMAVNFFGAVYLTAVVLPGMLERREGSIVNVSSVAGSIPNPNESAYGASKAALSLWSHGLAVELRGTGVHVGVLSPGPIDTEMWQHDEVPSAYTGRKYPPEAVAEGVARMIDKELVHLTVPRRYGAVGALYPLPGLGRLFRWSVRRYWARAEARRCAGP